MADGKPEEPAGGTPAAEDLRADDMENNPQVEPEKARVWLNLLDESEVAFSKWNDHCDKIDKLFANLERLSNAARDKEYQMFWANMEVIKPSIYAKPPTPVVVPKFKDRRPVPQAASEVMERCAIVAFDLTRINDTMLLIRDDVALICRGVAWVRYEEGGSGKDSYHDHEKVCIEFKERRDFLHSLSRSWPEVTWVAAASYLTRGEARKRFKSTSKDEYQKADYRVNKEAKDAGGADKRERAKFWEIWDKANRRVVWVAEGCELILDEDDPHLDLCGFFPCPKPAYGTVQRGSLVPVPEVLQYKDQLDEINLLTGRIHALSDALEAKGFYPAGGAELSDAVQSAIRTKVKGRLLVPISNWAAFGGSKEVIIWLPIDMIAQTITALVALRKQVTDDIYQITGLSDIMRGESDPNETLGAVQLKTDYGSVRVRDKQQEIARIARDLVEITSEIITEKFDPVTIIEMSQTQLPTQDLIRKQIDNIQRQMQAQQQQAEQLMQSPQIRQMAQQNPQAGQQAMQQFKQVQEGAAHAIQKLSEKPTIEQVLQFMKNQRTKSFVLDIETDSTIQADENTEKARRTEFVSVLGTLLPQLSAMITAEPQTASFCGELLKFATAPFRAGRSLDGAIDALVQQMEAKGNQPQGDNNPAQINAKTALQIENMKQETERLKIKQKQAQDAADMAQKDRHKQMEINTQFALKQMEQGMSSQEAQAQLAVQNQKLMESREAHQMNMIGKQQDMAITQQKADLQQQQHDAKLSDMSARQQDRRNQQQFNQTRQASVVPEAATVPDDYTMGDLAALETYGADLPSYDPARAEPSPVSLLDMLRGGARSVVGGLNAVSDRLGIPQGETRNEQGDVVFPTNALERGLQGTSDDAKTYAAAVMGPGKMPRGRGPTGFAPGRMGDLAEIASPNIIKGADVSVASPYVRDPLRVANPGVYKRPDAIAAEAAANVAPEHPALKELFGVTRDDLYGISQQGARPGNMEPTIWQPSRATRGSYAADAIMNPANAQRMVDTLSEAQKYPELIKGMDPWYVMDPMYQRMVELVGPERAKAEYMKFNAVTTPFSAGSNVPTELNRGTAANMMVTRDQFPKFVRNAGIAAEDRGRRFPSELAEVKGHAYHAIQADPVTRWLKTGEHGYANDTVKIPLYSQASGVPETGFQTRLPVPDAHFTRATGMPDVRRSKDFNDYMSGSEYRPIGPWFRENVAKPLGIEAVPAQARMWGTYAPQTGVDTKIGAGKLELLSQGIWERAKRLGINPKKLRDDVLRGKNHAELMGDVLNPNGDTA